MRREPSYQVFGWFERHLQRLKYVHDRGILAAVEAQRDELQAALEAGLVQSITKALAAATAKAQALTERGIGG